MPNATSNCTTFNAVDNIHHTLVKDVQPASEFSKNDESRSKGCVFESVSELPLSFVDGLKRMKILILDDCTPLILHGSEIIGGAWIRMGGDEMVQVDYLHIKVGTTVFPVPVLVPVSYFGGDVAGVQKWVSAQYEALTLIIEEKVSLVMNERDCLPSYLRLEEMNVVAASQLCREQFAAAQIFVEGKRTKATENLQWLRHIIADSIRNQYQDWRQISQEHSAQISEFLNTMKEHSGALEQVVPKEMSVDALKVQANLVFSNLMDDARVQSLMETGTEAKKQIDSFASDVREQAFKVIDIEMISFTRDYISEFLDQAKSTCVEPHMRNEIIQTIMMQTSMILAFMKNQFDTLLTQTQEVSGCDLSYYRELIHNVKLFEVDENDENLAPNSQCR